MKHIIERQEEEMKEFEELVQELATLVKLFSLLALGLSIVIFFYVLYVVSTII